MNMVEKDDIKIEIVDMDDILPPTRLNIARIELESDMENPVVYWTREARLYKGRLVKIPDIATFKKKVPKENKDGKLRHFNDESSEMMEKLLEARGAIAGEYLLKNPEGCWGYTKDVIDITEDILNGFIYSRIVHLQGNAAGAGGKAP